VTALISSNKYFCELGVNLFQLLKISFCEVGFHEECIDVIGKIVGVALCNCLFENFIDILFVVAVKAIYEACFGVVGCTTK